MSPEFGSTCAIFPIDAETLRYLEFTGRPTEQIELVDAYTREQGLFHEPDSEDADLQRHPRARPRRRRAEHRRAEAAAGPDRARRREARPSSRRCRSGTPRRARSWATAATRRSPSPSRPPTRPPRTTTATRGKPRAGVEPGGDVAVERADQRRGRGAARERRDGRARPRPRRDRGDHQLHQHLEPLGDARRRAARQEGGRARPAPPALGEDLARAGLDRGHRVPGEVRARQSTSTSSSSTWSATAAPPASATPARCRRRSRRRSTTTTWSVCAVLSGNRNFEGRINPDTRANYLASPAAGRRLRARRAHGHRPDQRAARRRTPTASPSTCRDIWPDLGGDQAGRRRGGRAPTCSPRATPTSSPATSAGTRDRGARGRPLHLARLDLRAQAVLLRGHGPPSRSRSSRSRAPGCWRCSATRSPPTTSPPPGAIKKDSPAGQVADRAGGRGPRLQLLRLAPRQPRGDDPRHLRQRPPPQPPGRARGRLHPPLPRTARRRRSTRPR